MRARSSGRPLVSRRLLQWLALVSLAFALLAIVLSLALYTHATLARPNGAKSSDVHRTTQTATAPGAWTSGAQSPDPLDSLLSLPNGKVLLSYLDNTYRANLYDPARNVWSQTHPFTRQIVGERMTLLPSGTALLTGGETTCSGVDCLTADVEGYHATSDSWSTLAPMSTQRAAQSATLLQNGAVLVAGGFNDNAPIGLNYLASAEIYHPSSNSWSAAASMPITRFGQTALLLDDGRVLVIGGETTTTASSGSPSPQCGSPCPQPTQGVELYNPATNGWSEAMPLPDARQGYTVTVLPTGKVLVAGGYIPNTCCSELGNLLYDPKANTWTAAAPMITPRYNHTATLLATGEVLVAGGFGFGLTGILASAELYDPATNTWTAAPTMNSVHGTASAIALADGRVFVNGGSTAGPGCCVANKPPTLPSLSQSPKSSGPIYAVDIFSTIPGTPSSVHATAGNGSATVTWKAPLTDGATITGYTVTSAPGSLHVTVSGTATSATISGLSNGTAYAFTVVASNSFGASPSSTSSNRITPTSPTPTPTPGSGGSGGNGTGSGAGSASATATSAPAATTAPVATQQPASTVNSVTSSNSGQPNWLLIVAGVLIVLILAGAIGFALYRRAHSLQ